MALKPGARPAPLRTDSNSSTSPQEQKKPQTPGSKFTSFFSRKQTASPGADSGAAESEPARSPLPSPWPTSATSATGYGFQAPVPGPGSKGSQDSIEFDPNHIQNGGVNDRAAVLEAELREISKELAGSIKREMDLEDTVERLQSENPTSGIPADRTSDYFSDSGTSSIRPPTSDYNPKEEIERIKRESEQQKAQLKVEFSQKWQREVTTRKAMESHLQFMEQRLKNQHWHRDESLGASSKAKELETSLDDTKRRLNEERQTNQNFEDLLGALREDLARIRNERDNLKDEVVPGLKARMEGLEAASADAQKAPYDVARMQHEIQSLRDENAALHSARMMNAQFESIAEENDLSVSRRNSMVGGLRRTGTIGRSTSRAGGLARSNSISKNLQNESRESLAEQLKAVEQQRDALHTAVKYLLRRQTHQNKQYEKRLQFAEAERDKAMRTALAGGRKHGYEKEVRVLRSEINLLRKRADDAMEQKWQCEKGLASLAMDLNRSKQETASLQRLLEVKDNGDPEVLSSALESAMKQLNQQRSQMTTRDSLSSLANEEELNRELERSAERSEALAAQVRHQLQNNSTLRNRLKQAIQQGEQSQVASAEQITELQAKLRKLEDTITAAQTQSETAVMKHEEEVRVMRASTSIHLLRAKNSNPNMLSPTPRSPRSPMLANPKKSPRIDQTSSGPGVALHDALKTEYLEGKVTQLEKALAEAELEMGEVVGRMNTAQISTAELEGERYVPIVLDSKDTY
jgi:DNA repair exonuclease SbcCD ATPase subunit